MCGCKTHTHRVAYYCLIVVTHACVLCRERNFPHFFLTFCICVHYFFLQKNKEQNTTVSDFDSVGHFFFFFVTWLQIRWCKKSGKSTMFSAQKNLKYYQKHTTFLLSLSSPISWVFCFCVCFFCFLFSFRLFVYFISFLVILDTRRRRRHFFLLFSVSLQH